MSAFRTAALAEPSLRGIFMPPLLAKWATLSDADAELLPLMECLMTIATALGGASGSSCSLQTCRSSAYRDVASSSTRACDLQMLLLVALIVA